MILWHVSTAVAAVAWVFRDPGFDYRMLAVGAVLPMVDAVTGGTWVLHSLAFSIALGVAVIVGTIGRPALRHLLLPLPIGTLLYLVFSGVWNDSPAFWWPFTGDGLGEGSVPFLERGWALTLLLEAIGAAAVVLGVRRARLMDPARRHELVHSGRLRFVVD